MSTNYSLFVQIIWGLSAYSIDTLYNFCNEFWRILEDSIESYGRDLTTYQSGIGIMQNLQIIALVLIICTVDNKDIYSFLFICSVG